MMALMFLTLGSEYHSLSKSIVVGDAAIEAIFDGFPLKIIECFDGSGHKEEKANIWAGGIQIIFRYSRNLPRPRFVLPGPENHGEIEIFCARIGYHRHPEIIIEKEGQIR